MAPPRTVTVHILDKEYQVACPEEQQDDLIGAARHLDRQMRSIRETGRVIGLERIAVMAALNMSYELLTTKGQDQQVELDLPDEQTTDAAYRKLSSKLDEALHQLRQMEIS
jgi:cell division protein ZapA